ARGGDRRRRRGREHALSPHEKRLGQRDADRAEGAHLRLDLARGGAVRSEEHTSELQSLTNLVCRLLLEKKKNNNKYTLNKPINKVAVEHVTDESDRNLR